MGVGQSMPRRKRLRIKHLKVKTLGRIGSTYMVFLLLCSSLFWISLISQSILAPAVPVEVCENNSPVPIDISKSKNLCTLGDVRVSSLWKFWNSFVGSHGRKQKVQYNGYELQLGPKIGYWVLLLLLGLFVFCFLVLHPFVRFDMPSNNFKITDMYSLPTNRHFGAQAAIVLSRTKKIVAKHRKDNTISSMRTFLFFIYSILDLLNSFWMDFIDYIIVVPGFLVGNQSCRTEVILEYNESPSIEVPTERTVLLKFNEDVILGLKVIGIIQYYHDDQKCIFPNNIGMMETELVDEQIIVKTNKVYSVYKLMTESADALLNCSKYWKLSMNAQKTFLAIFVVNLLAPFKLFIFGLQDEADVHTRVGLLLAVIGLAQYLPPSKPNLYEKLSEAIQKNLKEQTSFIA